MGALDLSAFLCTHLPREKSQFLMKAPGEAPGPREGCIPPALQKEGQGLLRIITERCRFLCQHTSPRMLILQLAWESGLEI